MKTFLLLLLSSVNCQLSFSQNVGIGTTTPQAPLHVKTLTYSEILRLEGINPYMTFWDNSSSIRALITASPTTFELSTLLNGLPITLSPGSFPRATFLNNGHVGIGTITPSERLHVVHTADVNKNTIYGYASQASGSTDYQNTGVAGFGQGNGTAGGFGFGFGVKGIGSLASYGAVGVYAGLGTTIPQNNLLGNNFYSLYADVGIAAANRYAAVFLNGNVGINNSTPQYKLDITGDANITGALHINGSPGAAGQVLTSNGSGTPQWRNAALSNNTRFAAQMPTSNASGGVSAFMTFSSNYNTNAANITVGADFITINHTGLYHFEGNIYEQVVYSSAPSSAPVFTLNFHSGSTIYNLINGKIIPVANYTPNIFYENNRFNIDLYVEAGNQVKLSRTFNASTTNLTSMYATGWFTGYLISE